MIRNTDRILFGAFLSFPSCYPQMILFVYPVDFVPAKCIPVIRAGASEFHPLDFPKINGRRIFSCTIISHEIIYPSKDFSNDVSISVHRKITAAIIITLAMAIGISVGLKTHHHDHAICPRSFRTIKTMVNAPKNPMPPEADAEADADLLMASPCLFHLKTHLPHAMLLPRTFVLLSFAGV